MRFALIATSAAAAVAVPFAMQATAPQMSGDQFVSAVRCAAYELAMGADEAETRWLLNAEARRQPIETVARAEAEADTIALQAVNIQSPADAAMMSRERAAACSGAQFATNGAAA